MLIFSAKKYKERIETLEENLLKEQTHYDNLWQHKVRIEKELIAVKGENERLKKLLETQEND